MDKISEDLVQRMAACIQAYATGDDDLRGAIIQAMGRTIHAEFVAIAAELPKPIDPDVLAVREILHAYQRALTPPDSGWGNMSYRAGSYDGSATFRAALAAYKATRTSGAS